MSVQIKGVGTIGGIDQGLNTVGVITATSFVGSGANLTNLPAQATIANNADNRVITGGSGVNLNGEANLTFDGSKLSIKGADTATGSGGPAALEIKQGDANNEFVNLALQTGSGGPLAVISAIADATGVYPNTTGQLTFNTQVGGGVFERLRIDSNGRLLVGTTTEGHAAADELTISNTTSAADMGITLRSATNGQGAIYFSDGTSGADEYRGIINYNHTNNFFSFYTNASEKLRIGSSGQIGLSGANYGSSGQVLTSGGSGSAPTWSTVASGGSSNISFNSGYGIDFSATADGTGSSQAEILDDYEEGSWSPTVSSSNASFSTLLGKYVKIGRQVTLWYRIAGGGSYSGSSALSIQGIPFTNNTAMNPIGTAEFYKIDFARDYSDHVTPYLSGSTLRWLRNGSGGGSGNYLTINLFYSGAAITGMITYETNS